MQTMTNKPTFRMTLDEIVEKIGTSLFALLISGRFIEICRSNQSFKYILSVQRLVL